MKLTDEQRMIVASRSNALRVIAFAGAGKTSTLKAYAEARTSQRFMYFAFNKSIALAAQKKFSRNVECLTTHSLAYRSFGRRYAHKLKANIKFNQIATVLGLRHQDPQHLRDARLAQNALEHFLSSNTLGFDQFSLAHGRAYSRQTYEAAERLWMAMIDEANVEMPMLHDGYLKLYQLSRPELQCDGILFDEAQDANPVTLDIIRNQTMFKVFVGDPHQQIYGFRRAENALDDPLLTDTLYLTESFRFGSNLAEVANDVLAVKREAQKIVGGRGIPPSQTSAYIARGNAALYTRAVDCALNSRAFSVVGGVERMGMETLLDLWSLKLGQSGNIRDSFIKGFRLYDDIVNYAEDNDDRNLKPWIGVLDRHQNSSQIPSDVELVKRLAYQSYGPGIKALTTAYKAKGLEFGHVELADDFPKVEIVDEPYSSMRGKDHPGDWIFGPNNHPKFWDRQGFKGVLVLPEEEINLRYVAVTRAEGSLDGGQAGNPPFRSLAKWVATNPRFIRLDSLPRGKREEPADSHKLRDSTSPASTAEPSLRYRAGARIRHKKFGVGTVVSAEGQAEVLRVLVQFSDGQQRLFLESLANFELA